MNQIRSNKIPFDMISRQQPARKFVAASSQGGSLTIPTISGAMSVCAWFNPLDLGNFRGIAGLFTLDGNHGLLLALMASGNVRMYLKESSTSTDIQVDSGTYPAGKWSFVCGTSNGSNRHRNYKNTSAPVASTTSGSALSVNVAQLGQNNTTFFNGSIAYPCGWNCELRSDEVYSMARGTPPWLIRPQSIVFCPDMRTLIDPITKKRLSVTTSTLVNSPMQFTPTRKSYIAASSGNRRRRFLATAA